MLRQIATLSGAMLTASRLWPQSSVFPAERDKFLDEVERRAFLYFYEQADPRTGLVRDRARAEGNEVRRVASIAATGFGLSALCIADQRRYISHAEAWHRIERTLTYLAGRAETNHGFFHHFLDLRTGQRAWKSEISSIDTTWLLCGVLHCRAYFESAAIRQLAADIFDRVDWRWMLNGDTTLSHGWTPEGGFLPYRWDSYSELLAMYLLAMGSATFPIPSSTWEAWTRPVRTYRGLSFIDARAPLFTHQYSHAWFDFRWRRDRYADYFENSRRATQAHRLYCIKMAQHFPWYGKDMWGVTASDSRSGYVAWGGDLHGRSLDGTLVPCAAGGSIVFMPEECGTVLETMLDRYGKQVWKRYGFVDAFQPGEGWFDRDVIGVDQGIMMMMIENLRSQSVWRNIMTTPEAVRAMSAAGFRDESYS